MTGGVIISGELLLTATPEWPPMFTRVDFAGTLTLKTFSLPFELIERKNSNKEIFIFS